MSKITSYKQAKIIQDRNKAKLLALFPSLPESSGIYILTRKDSGFKYAYIGQAKNILSRLAQHLSGYQHIDLSIKSHGLLSEQNPTGWNIKFGLFPEDELNEKEQYYIRIYANQGYQLRNKTAGSQGKGKFGIDDNKPSKGYYDGLKQGYINAQRDVAKLFEKNLTYSINGNPNKNKEKALQKFNDFLNIDKKNEK